MINEEMVQRFEVALRAHMASDAEELKEILGEHASLDFKIEALDGDRLRATFTVEGPADKMVGTIEAE